MRETASNLGTKALAVLVLLLAAYLVFKLLVGAVTAVAWTLVAVLAVVAVVWALTRL